MFALLAWSTPAAAIDDGGEPLPSPCLEMVKVSFNASPSTVALGQSTTLSWNVTGCPASTKSITGLGTVPSSGTRVITPTASGTRSLTVRYGGASKSWSIPVTVALPKDQYGRINVTITSNDQAALFVQAISSAESTNAVVHIQNHVSLDLSYRQNIHLYPGVQIFGGRTAKDPGPLLFTTTYSQRLFVIGDYLDTDNVRISGIRLQGADTSVAEESSPSSIGIMVNSSLNVEIDNNEISGWHVAAISVKDSRNRIDQRNGAGAVRIHDNSLHNNQRIGEGYGVEVVDGAYALIEKNTFDFNRHAVASDGEFGSGYFFYRNLVGTGGGQHEGFLGIDYQTHQIDMHGQDDCWGADGYCGIAGQYMDIRYNSIMYTAGLAILLRGSPTDRMEVTRNAFAHTDEWGHWLYDRGAAMSQSDSVPGYGSLVRWDNRFGAKMTGFGSICDFDGDGVNDTFSANGATWRYAAGGATNGHNGYRYLNTSTLAAAELDFGDFNGDGKCDVKVKADGRISSGGRTPLERLQSTDILLRNPANAQPLRITHIENAAISGETFPAIPANRQVLGTGDFDGDGDSDILSKETLATSQRINTSLLQGGVVVADFNPGYVEADAQFQGIADFDGDGASDVLWRLADGSLRMRLRPKAAGNVGSDAIPSYRNLGNPAGVAGFEWQIKAVGDFNGDGYADIVWRHDNGQVSVWLMVGSIWIGDFGPGGPNEGLTWKIQAVGDFDGDGRSDLLWRYIDGALAIWFKGSDGGAAYPTYQNVPGANAGQEWQIQGVSDFNQDGRSDILWRHTNGFGVIWFLNGGSWIAEAGLQLGDANWQTQGLLPRH